MSTEVELFEKHPSSTDRRDLPRIKREWEGRRVAVRYIRERGSSRRHTHMGWAWGLLVKADQDIHVAVRERDGRIRNIHYKRVTVVFDLTRTLPTSRT